MAQRPGSGSWRRSRTSALIAGALAGCLVVAIVVGVSLLTGEDARSPGIPTATPGQSTARATDEPPSAPAPAVVVGSPSTEPPDSRSGPPAASGSPQPNASGPRPTIALDPADAALAANISTAIAPDDGPADPLIIGPIVRITASGAITPSRPLVVEIPYSPGSLQPDPNRGTPRIWLRAGGDWMPLMTSETDATRGVVRAQIDSLGAPQMPHVHRLVGPDDRPEVTRLDLFCSMKPGMLFYSITVELAVRTGLVETVETDHFLVFWYLDSLRDDEGLKPLGGAKGYATTVAGQLERAFGELKPSWGEPKLGKANDGKYLSRVMYVGEYDPRASALYEPDMGLITFPAYRQGKVNRVGIEDARHELSHAMQAGFRPVGCTQWTEWSWIMEATAVAHEGWRNIPPLVRASQRVPMRLDHSLEWSGDELAKDPYPSYYAGDFFVYAALTGPHLNVRYMARTFELAGTTKCRPLECLDSALREDRQKGLPEVYADVVFAIHAQATGGRTDTPVAYPQDLGSEYQLDVRRTFGANRREGPAGAPPAIEKLGARQGAILEIRPDGAPAVAVTLLELPKGVAARGYRLLADDRVDWGTPPHEAWGKPWEVSGLGDQVKGLRLVIANGTGNEVAITPRVATVNEDFVGRVGRLIGGTMRMTNVMYREQGSVYVTGWGEEPDRPSGERWYGVVVARLGPDRDEIVVKRHSGELESVSAGLSGAYNICGDKERLVVEMPAGNRVIPRQAVYLLNVEHRRLTLISDVVMEEFMSAGEHGNRVPTRPCQDVLADSRRRPVPPDKDCPLGSRLPVSIVVRPMSNEAVHPSILFETGRFTLQADPATGADDLLILCEPSGGGYQVNTSQLAGSTGAGWSFRFADKWLSDNGVNVRTAKISRWAICRNGPRAGLLVRTDWGDQRCFQD